MSNGSVYNPFDNFPFLAVNLSERVVLASSFDLLEVDQRNIVLNEKCGIVPKGKSEAWNKNVFRFLWQIVLRLRSQVPVKFHSVDCHRGVVLCLLLDIAWLQALLFVCSWCKSQYQVLRVKLHPNAETYPCNKHWWYFLSSRGCFRSFWPKAVRLKQLQIGWYSLHYNFGSVSVRVNSLQWIFSESQRLTDWNFECVT